MTADKRIDLCDSTLRDGAQTQGVDFSVADKIAIAQHAQKRNERMAGLQDALGICRIQFNGSVQCRDIGKRDGTCIIKIQPCGRERQSREIQRRL